MPEYSRFPMAHYHTTFGATLRQLADTEPDAERARQMALLASQLEVAFDQQGSNVQVALWDVQDSTRQKIDDLHAHQSDTNLLLSNVIEAVNGLRGDVQASAVESAARLGKLEEGQNDLADRVTALELTISARPAERMAEHQAIIDEFSHRLEAFEIAFARLGASMALFDDAIVVIDHAQRITWTNQETLDMFGYMTEELIGEPIDILIPERYRDAHRAHIIRFAKSSTAVRRMGERQAIAGRHKDGTEFPIKAAIAKVPDGYTAVVRRLNGG